MKKYKVTLTEQEREELGQRINKGKVRLENCYRLAFF